MSGGDPAAGNDERIDHTEYLVDTSRWLMLPTRKWTADLAGKRYSDQKIYYDGPAFQGLPYGQADKGLMTRTSAWLGPDDDTWVDTTRVARDAYGNVIETHDANGHVTKVTYDDATHTFPTGQTFVLADHTLTMHATFDPGLGVLTKYVGANGHTTTVSYDGLGRATAIVEPGDSASQPTDQFEYHLGSPVSSVLLRQRRTSGKDDFDVIQRFFDGLSRPRATATKTADGRWDLTAFVTFDARGKVRDTYQGAFVDQVDVTKLPTTPYTRQFYDALGRVVATRLPDGNAAYNEYLPLAVRRSDPDDADPSSPHYKTPTLDTLDGLGRLISEVELNAGNPVEVDRSYDPLGHLVSTKDAEGNVRHYTYASTGWVLSVDDPDEGQWTFTYDPMGNETARTDPTGRKVTFGYDDVNRPTWVDLGADGTHDIVDHYDNRAGAGAGDNLLGALASATDPAGDVTFSYDPRGRLVDVARTIGQTVYESTYHYDDRNRIVDRGYPDGTHVRRTYDHRGNLVALDGATHYLTQVYDAKGMLTERKTGDGVDTTLTYDAQLRPKTQRVVDPSGKALLDLTYAYDPVGNPLSVTDGLKGVSDALNRSASYKYDDLYRLVHAGLPGGGLDWSYSPSGNMLSRTATGLDKALDTGAMTYGQNAGPHAMTGYDGRTLTYDAAGRMTSDGQRTFSWDDLGRLGSVTLPDGTQVQNAYGYDGKRVEKQVVDGSGKAAGTTIYVDPSYQVQDGHGVIYLHAGSVRIGRFDALTAGQTKSAMLLRSVVLPGGKVHLALLGFLGFGLVGLVLVDTKRGRRRWYRVTSILVVLIFGDACTCTPVTPIHHAPNTDVVYFHHDRLGSVAELTQNGKTLLSRVFRPFGSVRGSSGSTPAHYAFTGKERDAKTGLDNFGARFYDATLSHWISADPLALRRPTAMLGGVDQGNVFSYVGNRPTTLTDPTGLEGFFKRFWKGFKKSLHSGVGNVVADVKAHPDRYAHGSSIWQMNLGPGGAQKVVQGVVASSRGAIPLAMAVVHLTMIMVTGGSGDALIEAASMVAKPVLKLLVKSGPRGATRIAMDNASESDTRLGEDINRVIDMAHGAVTYYKLGKIATKMVALLKEGGVPMFTKAMRRVLDLKWTGEQKQEFIEHLHEVLKKDYDLNEGTVDNGVDALADHAREKAEARGRRE